MNNVLPYFDPFELLAPESSWRRHVAAIVAELVSSVGISYAMSAAVTPIILGTSSVALAWCVFVLSVLLTIAATIYSAGAINRYIYNRRVDHDIATVRRGMRNLYARVRGRLVDIDSKEIA